MRISEPKFGGISGTTARESEPWWEPKAPLPGHPPNILQIVFDDTGWADFGCFGSEIDTPNLDSLANAGLRYTNFHVTPLCSPTRACLFTGRNHHRVGMRFLADIDTGFPNSRGRVDPQLPMIPAQLSQAGYGTYLVGKWHLAPQHEITPAGPFGHWPLARGFDRFFGFLDGCTDQFSPELFEDNHVCNDAMPRGQHLSSALADRAITLLADHALYRNHDPFYLTFAPGATHAPLQAPRHLIEKYIPVFEKGWDRTRQDRLERQIALGLVPEGAALTDRNPGVLPWDELGADEKRLFVHQQAAYAAFLEHCDAEIGRILVQLDKLGLRDNTAVIVMSDNGSSKEGGRSGAIDVNSNYSGAPEPLARQLERLEDIGGPNGPAHYPEGWAMAGNTPFRRYKQSVDLGGVRSPLIVSWPKGIADKGAIRHQFAHVIDLGATVVDLAGLRDRVGMDGESLHNSFASALAPSPRNTQYWEMFGHRAIWQDGWKAVTEHIAGTSYEDDQWRLYDTNSDFAENNDVAAQYPDRLADMVATWWREAKSNQVLPLDDRSLVTLLNETRTPHQLANRQRLVLYPENAHVPVSTGVTSVGRSVCLTASLNKRRPGTGGVIVAAGACQGGYAFYIANDQLVFEHLALGVRERIQAPLSGGERRVAVAVRHGPEYATIALLVEGVEAASTRVAGLIIHPSFWGLDIGRGPAEPITLGYSEQPFFPDGVLESVQIEFLDEMTMEGLADLIAQAE